MNMIDVKLEPNPSAATVEGDSAACRGCEVMRKEDEIQQVKVKERISYANAAKRVGGGKRVRAEEDGKQERADMWCS